MTGLGRGGRMQSGPLTDAVLPVNSSFVTSLHFPKANGGNRSPHRRAGDPAGTLLRLHQRLP
ncbi:hypothetical protein MICRO8M_100159 [Microbacterium sp. 8M]|nr:hypothetical protein MICRO8M_100159 [Microbacterium sp. 8M]